jgi:hypothetical protein
MITGREMTGTHYKLVQKYDATFDEHEFTVGDEGKAKISLLSVSQDSYVRMDNEGGIDGNYTTSKESKLFTVELLMPAPRRTH